jgi:hypothetical protein
MTQIETSDMPVWRADGSREEEPRSYRRACSRVHRAFALSAAALQFSEDFGRRLQDQE